MVPRNRKKNIVCTRYAQGVHKVCTAKQKGNKIDPRDLFCMRRPASPPPIGLHRSIYLPYVKIIEEKIPRGEEDPYVKTLNCEVLFPLAVIQKPNKTMFRDDEMKIREFEAYY